MINKRYVLQGFGDCILACANVHVPLRNIKLWSTAKVCHGMLINIGFNELNILSVELAPESSMFHRLYESVFMTDHKNTSGHKSTSTISRASQHREK